MKKIAIVTGASRGIGRAVAKRLAQDGFAVVVNYLSNASEAEEVVAEIKVIGGEAIAVKADVANQTDVERLFEETMKKFGSVDVVVHNSGIMPLSPIGKSDVELFDKVISTNLRGAFLVLAQAAQHIAVGGRIIAFSSSVLAKSFPSYTVHTLRRRRPSKAWCMCWRTNSADAILASMPSRPAQLQPNSF
jgi:3-oxoacyl-[acyl-carrier protein] reductase